MIESWFTDTKKENDTLIKIDGWTLENIGMPLGDRLNPSRYISLIKHECCPDRVRPSNRGKLTGINQPTNERVVHKVVCYPEDTDACWRCEDKIPEQLVVVWTFQNWNTIQRRTNYHAG
jgi:hypothetical protein